MTTLAKLRAANELRDLATLLNFTPAGLAYVLYKIPENQKYSTFDIPKKSGGVRVIKAPGPQLKYLQTSLAKLLSDCIGEIESQAPERKNVSHGFHRARSIVTNASCHRARRYVINIDLSDFFGTINFGRVRGFFINDRNFLLKPGVATVIAQIACHENSLPQGAPSSPVLSNLVGHILDVSMIGVAKKHGASYTRYADDITISTNRRSLPRLLAHRSKADSSKWLLGFDIREAVRRAGFRINDKKTRVQIRGSRQEVTGLVVNKLVNVPAERYRATRLMCHALFVTGKYHLASRGKADSIADYAVLEGRLAHCFYVKARRDRPSSVNRRAAHDPPKALVSLYRRFLFHKYCVANERPLIITEGKTDIIYLKAAIAALGKDSELLDSKGERLVGFLSSSYTNQAILNLGGGFGGMPRFIREYKQMVDAYKYAPLECPVVLVVDRDDAAKAVFKAAKELLGKDISASGDIIHHIAHNLYVVVVPISKTGSQVIEGCFDNGTLNWLWKGMSFNSGLSKIAFAEKVVFPNRKKIDFTGFKPILAAIATSIDEYRKARKESRPKEQKAS